ncbi:zf-C3HC4 domain-containing protein [Naegleria gruberi]|uniref:E3 ubiquitin-protein ligase listerin n=1 Tax=Naegleria gruberi TaxID=5762 RepID=D2VE26_NAEGR|nr:zf-C3HC4 domain-containing protein [Naegleria gruberi]EFC45004.1 zf-C3HC4 domain-containing protein [Naegleria gruberi]|eukprot:XP_002677748.1 zf-C3HC4 domain-containing protein [Naegleria gruberi strain NEG-M]
MGKNTEQRKPKSQKGAISASQAANVLSSKSGSSSSGGLLGSSLMEAFSKKSSLGSSSLDSSSSSSSSSSLDPTVQSYLKHLNKRDPTTRCKALQSLTQYISEQQPEDQTNTCKNILEHFEEVFKKIAVIDLDRKVRLNLFILWKLIVQNVGKKLGFHIKKIMPYWLMEMVGIDDRDVSKAAIAAFHQGFPPEKRDAAILYCDNEIMNNLFENFNQTVESLSLNETEQQSITKEEAEERYSRFITSSILMLNKMIDLTTQQQQQTSQPATGESYKKIFGSKNFWKFLGIKSYTNIREAMSRLTITLLKNDLLKKDDPEVVEHIVPFVAPIFIGCFNQQPLERTTLDSLILFLQKFAPECWAHVNVWKQTFPRFFSFLKDPSNPSINYPIVLPFISMLNTSIYGADKSIKFVSDLFENMWIGFEKYCSSNNPNVNSATNRQAIKADRDAIIDSICNCIIYIALQTEKYCTEEQKPEILKITRSTLEKITIYYLTNSNTVNYGKYLSAAITKIQSKPELAEYMNQFWSEITNFTLNNINKIDVVSIEIFISRCVKEKLEHVFKLAHELFDKCMMIGQIDVASAVAFSYPTVLKSTLFEDTLKTLWQTSQFNEHVQQIVGLYFTQFQDQFEKFEKVLEEEIKEGRAQVPIFPLLRSLYSEEETFSKTSVSLEKSLLARRDLDSIEYLITHKLYSSKEDLRRLLTDIISNGDDLQERAVEFIISTPSEYSIDKSVLFALFKGAHYGTLAQLISDKPKQQEDDEEEEQDHDEEEVYTNVITSEMKSELLNDITIYLKDIITQDSKITNDIILDQFLKLVELSGSNTLADSVLLNYENDSVWSFIRNQCASNLKPIVIGNQVIWNSTKDTNVSELEKSVIKYSRLVCVVLSYVEAIHKNQMEIREQKWEWLVREVLHSFYFEFLFNDFTKNLINKFLAHVNSTEGLNLEFCEYLAHRHELELLKIYISMNSDKVSGLDCSKLLFKTEDVNDVISDKNKSNTFYELVQSLFDNDTDLRGLTISNEKVTEWLLGCISISSTLDNLSESSYDHLNLIKVQAALSIVYCKQFVNTLEDEEEITIDSIIDFAKEFYEQIKQSNSSTELNQISIIVANLLISVYGTNDTVKIEDNTFVEQFITSNLQELTNNLENNFELLDKIIHLSACVAKHKKNIMIVEKLIHTFLLLNRESLNLSNQYPTVMERLISRSSKYLKPLQLYQNYSEIKLESNYIKEILEIIENSQIANAKIVATDLLLLTNYHQDGEKVLKLMENMKKHVPEQFNNILQESAVRNKHMTQFVQLYSEYSNDNNNELPYLLSWYYILCLIETDAISQDQNDNSFDLFTKLKESQAYAPILSLLTCFLYSGEDAMFSMEFREFGDDLMYKFSKVLPLFVRMWFNNCNDTVTIDWIQKRFSDSYSPAIIRDEISKIKKSDALSKSLGAKISMGNQIIAKYEQDEVVLKLTIKIPDLYPLKPLQIESNEHSAVDENKYRKWILKMTTMLFSQVTSNGVSDVLVLWKENLDKHFQGVEPCPICYSVVSGRDHQIPKVECKICHNKFHGACIYRWFSTSGNQTCPMCRSIGQFVSNHK